MATCKHDHDCAEHDCSAEWSLYKHIDLPRVWALNEAVEGSVKSVFKSWDQRLSHSSACLESNNDDVELLVFIPFTCDVKIKSISVIGETGGSSPAKMRAYINREDIDFSDVRELSPVQEWELAENSNGEFEYQTRHCKFDPAFSENFGASTTRIHYIGLKGEATQIKRDKVTTIVYEALPNPSEHKVPGEQNMPEIL